MTPVKALNVENENAVAENAAVVPKAPAGKPAEAEKEAAVATVETPAAVPSAKKLAPVEAPAPEAQSEAPVPAKAPSVKKPAEKPVVAVEPAPVPAKAPKKNATPVETEEIAAGAAVTAVAVAAASRASAVRASEEIAVLNQKIAEQEAALVTKRTNYQNSLTSLYSAKRSTEEELRHLAVRRQGTSDSSERYKKLTKVTEEQNARLKKINSKIKTAKSRQKQSLERSEKAIEELKAELVQKEAAALEAEAPVTAPAKARTLPAELAEVAVVAAPVAMSKRQAKKLAAEKEAEAFRQSDDYLTAQKTLMKITHLDKDGKQQKEMEDEIARAKREILEEHRRTAKAERAADRKQNARSFRVYAPSKSKKEMRAEETALAADIDRIVNRTTKEKIEAELRAEEDHRTLERLAAAQESAASLNKEATLAMIRHEIASAIVNYDEAVNNGKLLKTKNKGKKGKEDALEVSFLDRESALDAPEKEFLTKSEKAKLKKIKKGEAKARIDLRALQKEELDAESDRVAYRIEALTCDLKMTDARFGADNATQKQRKRLVKRRLKGMKSGKTAVLRAAKRNEAVYEALLTHETNGQRNGYANAAYLEQLQERVLLLLTRRDELNHDLKELYGTGKNKALAKADRVRVSAAKSMRRAQSSYAKRVASLRVPSQEKAQIFEAMNRRTVRHADLEELKFVKAKTRPRGAALSHIENEIRLAKFNENNAKMEVESLYRRALERDKYRPTSHAGALPALIVLLVIIGAFGAAYALGYIDQLSAWLSGVFGKFRG